MPSIRQRRQRRSRQQQRGGRRSARRGVPSTSSTNVEQPLYEGGRRRGARRFSRRGVPTPSAPVEEVAVMKDGEMIPVDQVPSNEVQNIGEVVQMSPEQVESLNGGRSRRLRRGRRASRAAQRGGRAVSLKTAVRLLRNYYAKRYA